jgi:hypothetical protein
MKTLRTSGVFFLLALLPCLSACGGGGGGGATGGSLPSLPSTTTTVPTSDPASTSTPAPTATPSPAPSSAPVTTSAVSHVLTAEVLYGYGGTPATTPLSAVQPYVSWVQTDSNYAAQIRAAGIKVDVYTNFWRNYASDNPNVGYDDLKPGGAHAAAEALDCSGVPIVDPNYGGGYEADARSSAAAGHAQVVASYRLNEFHGNYDALFADDTGAVGGIPLPCNFSQSTYESDTNAVDASLSVPMFVNTLGAGSYPDQQVGFAQASNVIGAMCEECYAAYNSSKVDYAIGGTTWQHTENAEIAMVAMHKIFWDYARAIGDPTAETGLRTFIYASFLLTYDPSYAMLQEAFQSASGFPIMPETGLVPMNPATTATDVGGYATSGLYMRTFGACFYRGASVGACAVLVNPSGSAVPIPPTAYAHSMALTGGGVLDGGSASFTAPAPTSLGPDSGAILVQ